MILKLRHVLHRLRSHCGLRLLSTEVQGLIALHDLGTDKFFQRGGLRGARGLAIWKRRMPSRAAAVREFLSSWVGICRLFGSVPQS